MKFSSLQENLAEGLQIVFRAVPTKGSLPILSNVYIATENGRLKLAATDLATTIMTYVGASIDKPGAVTVPAKLLKDFVSTVQPGTLDIILKEDIFHIASDQSKSKFNSIHADDYPELPEAAIENQLLELEPLAFTEAIATVSFASGTDTSRPIFAGTLIQQEGTKLTIASTDGYRLSERTLDIDATQGDFTAVIPTKALMEVARIFAKAQEPIQVALSGDENQVVFLSGDTYVSTRIIDGQYPPYKQIIPQETTLSAKFSTEDFLNAVRLTSVFATAGDGGNAIKIVFDPENQVVKVVSLAEETGEHESQIPATVDGELTEIAFNVKYILDYLSNIKGTETTIKTNGNTSPCIFSTKEHPNLMHIIMPIQI